LIIILLIQLQTPSKIFYNVIIIFNKNKIKFSCIFTRWEKINYFNPVIWRNRGNRSCKFSRCVWIKSRSWRWRS